MATTDPTSQSFLRSETGGAVVLLGATVVALVWANIDGASYARAWDGDVRDWINDWVMALFFFVIGLEIKREVVQGELGYLRTALLPVAGAIGGMVVPALVFLLVVGSSPARDAWGVPMATDVAFALGALALFGRQSPTGLRVFLLTLAVADDVGASVVIAVAYSGGVHPTLVGVVLALLVPAQWLWRLEDRLHPVSTLAVVPLFALANAGLALDGGALRAAWSSRLTWAIVAGLAIGKAVGITAAVAGIGFTVSLFIVDLALPAALQPEAKVGVLAGSLASALVGGIVLARPRSRVDAIVLRWPIPTTSSHPRPTRSAPRAWSPTSAAPSPAARRPTPFASTRPASTASARPSWPGW